MSVALDKLFDKYYCLLTEYPKEKNTNQRLAGLEDEARQPRLATEAGVETDKQTLKRTEGTAAADRAKHNVDSVSARTVDAGPLRLTNFGKIAEPPWLLKKSSMTRWSTRVLKRQGIVSHP